MTEIPKVGNGKNWLAKGLLQVIIILALSAYGLVMTLENKSTRQDTRSKEESRQVYENSNRLGQVEKDVAALKDCIIGLRSVPTDVAGIKATVESMKSTVDKMDIKFQNHIDKGK